MTPKPKHLGPEYGAQFRDQSVVAAYPHKPPYPAEVFTVLASLVRDAPRTVLDLGCGTGDIARVFAPQVDRLDAVDPSPAMPAMPARHSPVGGIRNCTGSARRRKMARIARRTRSSSPPRACTGWSGRWCSPGSGVPCPRAGAWPSCSAAVSPRSLGETAWTR